MYICVHTLHNVVKAVKISLKVYESIVSLGFRLLTEHVLQADDAGEVIVKVDVEFIIRKPQGYQLE